MRPPLLFLLLLGCSQSPPAPTIERPRAEPAKAPLAAPVKPTCDYSHYYTLRNAWVARSEFDLVECLKFAGRNDRDSVEANIKEGRLIGLELALVRCTEIGDRYSKVRIIDGRAAVRKLGQVWVINTLLLTPIDCDAVGASKLPRPKGRWFERGDAVELEACIAGTAYASVSGSGDDRGDRGAGSFAIESGTLARVVDHTATGKAWVKLASGPHSGRDAFILIEEISPWRP